MEALIVPDSDSGEDQDEVHGHNDDDGDDDHATRPQPRSRQNIPQDQQRLAAIEGVDSEVRKFLNGSVRNRMAWNNFDARFKESNVDENWKQWGKIPDNGDGHLLLREEWLTWMACTSKLLQTVDNRHLNRHLDYMYSGPTLNFVDLQTTPQIGRRLNILASLVESINNFGEFPLDCVVATPETELLFGAGRNSKLVRGMRMKNSEPCSGPREVKLTSADRPVEKWLKRFRRGTSFISNPKPDTKNLNSNESELATPE
jgi:hypothetical protein